MISHFRERAMQIIIKRGRGGVRDIRAKVNWDYALSAEKLNVAPD